MDDITPHVLLCVAFVLHFFAVFLSYLDVLLLENLFSSLFWSIIFGVLVLYDVFWMSMYFASVDMVEKIRNHYRLYIFSIIPLNIFMGIIVWSTAFVDLKSEPFESNNDRFKEYLSIYPILSGPLLFIWFATAFNIRTYFYVPLGNKRYK